MWTEIGTTIVPEQVQKKEIEMSTNRLFVFSIKIALVAITAVVTKAAFDPGIVVTGADSSFIQSKDDALRESQLGERYGELPGYIDGFSPEQIQREYVLGERYGEMPQLIAQFSAEQILREYWLGERYGVTPQQHARDKAVREYWLGERYGQTPITLFTP